MRFSVVTTLVAALALGCDNPSSVGPSDIGPAFAPHRSEQFKSVGEFELRGLEDCFGELVIVTGEIRVAEHIVTSTETGNQDHSSLQFLLKGTGVGQETGALYKFREVSYLRFNTPNLEAPHFTAHDKVLTHVITQGSRRNVKLTLDVRVVMNGQGVRKVVVTEREPCQR